MGDRRHGCASGLKALPLAPSYDNIRICGIKAAEDVQLVPAVYMLHLRLSGSYIGWADLSHRRGSRGHSDQSPDVVVRGHPARVRPIAENRVHRPIQQKNVHW